MPLSVTTTLCQAIKASRQRLDDHSSNTAHALANASSSGSGVLINTHVQVPYRCLYATLDLITNHIYPLLTAGTLSTCVCYIGTVSMASGRDHRQRLSGQSHAAVGDDANGVGRRQDPGVPCVHTTTQPTQVVMLTLTLH